VNALLSSAQVNTTAASHNRPGRDPAQAARFFGNQLVTGSGKAFDIEVWSSLALASKPPKQSLVVAGFDGSRVDDHTALIATDVATGFCWPVGIWDPQDHGGEIPRDKVAAALDDLFHDYKVLRVYCDPPYLGETRGMRWREKGYQHEMTESDHRQLAEVLCGIQGLAILSGYPSALYAELFPGWRMVTKRSRINSLHNSCAMKTEALYLSPRAAAGVKQAHFELPESESIHSDIQQHRGE